jgi:hypothetical protein
MPSLRCFSSAVTAGYYRLDADVSPPVASSDLKNGVAAGLLGAQGATRDRHYFAGPRLYAVLIEELGLDHQNVPPSRPGIIAGVTGRLATYG